MREKSSLDLQQILARHTIDVQLALADRQQIENIARQGKFSALFELALTLEELTQERQDVTFDLVSSASAQYYLDGVAEQDIIFQPFFSQEVYALLFRCAAIGGEMGGGCFGAFGRLYAWQSLAGLVGMPPGATPEAVFEAAQQSTCCYVWAPSQWFHQIVTEFGLFVLRPDRRSGAFLAATDTD